MGPLARKNSMTCNLNEGLLKQRWYIPAVVGWICITDKSPIHLMPMWLWSCANLVLLWEWQFCKGIAERHTVPRLLGMFSASWLKIGLRVAELNLFWQNPSLCQVLCVTMTLWCPDSSGGISASVWATELRPRRAVLWRWLEERMPCRACAVSLPCTCSSTTPSAGPNGLKAGWLISRYKPVKIFLTKTLLLWLKVKHFHSSIFFYREGFWCPCSSLFLASLWLALMGLDRLFRNQNLSQKNKNFRWVSEVVSHILNFKTHKWSPLRFVAIAGATNRISVQIFLQSSIRWVG